MTKKTVETLRTIVIKQRALLNKKCKELEISKAASENYKKLYECEKKIDTKQFEYTQKQYKCIEDISKLLELNRIFTRIAVVYMLRAFNDGYKFPDKETENVFFQLCDEIGANDTVLKTLFEEFKASN